MVPVWMEGDWARGIFADCLEFLGSDNPEQVSAAAGMLEATKDGFSHPWRDVIQQGLCLDRLTPTAKVLATVWCLWLRTNRPHPAWRKLLSIMEDLDNEYKEQNLG
jgi:hypothetical protein